MLKRLCGLFMVVFICMPLCACGGTEKIKTYEKEGVNYLVLVNKDNIIPDDWESKVQMTSTNNLKGETIKVEKETLESFLKLREDLLEDGIDIELEAAYRSFDTQKDRYDSIKEERGTVFADDYISKPGYSENQTGLSVDIVLVKEGFVVHGSESLLQEVEIFYDIQKKLSEYGFILRYPKHKEVITGHMYEPWHLRYVGSPEIAREISDKNLTLEEYVTTK